jgi:peroxiredoxin
MIELGELERHAADFDQRHTRVVVVSIEDQKTARESKEAYPHLTVVADADGRMCEALQVVHPGAGPGGKDIAAPTTILVDGQGRVRWLFRSDRLVSRLSPEQLLAAVDEHLAGG